MAIYTNVSWLKVITTTEKENNPFKIECVDTDYKGRLARHATVTVTTAANGGTPGVSKSISVTQNGLGAYITISTPQTSFTADAQTINVTIHTNCTGVRTAITENGSTATATVGNQSVEGKSGSTTNGTAIVDDPGASGDVTITQTISLPANTKGYARTFKIQSYDIASGSTVSSNEITITQAAGTDTINLSPTTVDFNAAGKYVVNGTPSGNSYADITVTSNDEWSVAVTEVVS